VLGIGGAGETVRVKEVYDIGRIARVHPPGEEEF
jgi:hypothetical protein